MNIIIINAVMPARRMALLDWQVRHCAPLSVRSNCLAATTSSSCEDDEPRKRASLTVTFNSHPVIDVPLAHRAVSFGRYSFHYRAETTWCRYSG